MVENPKYVITHLILILINIIKPATVVSYYLHFTKYSNKTAPPSSSFLGSSGDQPSTQCMMHQSRGNANYPH